MDARGESDSVREARLKVRLDIMASHDRGAIMKTAPVGRAAFAIDSVSAMESKWENALLYGHHGYTETATIGTRGAQK